jgi:ATP-binding cassette, subfamily B, heavy metal transporter
MRKEKKEKIDFKYNLKTYISFIKEHKLAFISVLFFVLLIETLNIADKYLFKIITDYGTEFASGSIAREIFVNILLIVGGVFLFFTITKTISRWLMLHILNKFESQIVTSLKKKYFNHIIGLSHGFHTSHKTGSLISRMSRGGRAIERMTDLITFDIAPLIFQFLVVGISFALLDITSGIIVLITTIIFVAYNVINRHYAQNSNLKANKSEDYEKGFIADVFTNVDSIKYFGKKSFIQARFARVAENTRKRFLENWTYFKWLASGQSLILGLGTFFLILFSLIKFLNGQITLGTIVFIYMVYLGLIGPLFSFVHGIRDFYKVMADFDDLFKYGKIENEIKENPGAKKMKIRHGTVHFKNISFNYGKRKIFKNLDLKINKNEKVALVGHSGCGKTTLIKLLYRFYDVNSGKILVDGKEIKNVKQESLRNEMSVVPQECILFDDTIYNNILFSRPNATRKEVMKAIKFSQLDKIIKKFPKKESTIVGERGVKLSGGEKQRVSIARAILANKRILVLDEATSALDSETEHEIQKDLHKLMEGRTSIIIAHRLSTIMKADKIIVMKNGKIVQTGSHKELIAQEGEYQKLWAFQKGGYLKEPEEEKNKTDNMKSI